MTTKTPEMPEEIICYMGAASGHPQILRAGQNLIDTTRYVRADIAKPITVEALVKQWHKYPGARHGVTLEEWLKLAYPNGVFVIP